MNAHTPGPWQWFERTPGRPYLATPDRGQLYVMGFVRKGMQGACPVFANWPGIESGTPRERKGGVMADGLLLRDGSMHPDARLIAAAPEMLEALKLAYRHLNGGSDSLTPMEHDRAFKLARDAIAKATGAAG